MLPNRHRTSPVKIEPVKSPVRTRPPTLILSFGATEENRGNYEKYFGRDEAFVVVRSPVSDGPSATVQGGRRGLT